MNIELLDNYGNYVIPDDCRNGIAVDIGCNNGGFIERYKDFFQKIYAYDANIFLVNLLKEKYKIYENIFIFNKAAWSKDNEQLKLLQCQFTQDNGSYAIEKNIEVNVWDKNKVICEVSTISLESILNTVDNIDYLKIDCETSEYEFLLNKDLSNIKYIGMELHDQLGLTKYTELYNFISKTHSCNQELNYRSGHHQEILFTKKI